jgi:hypothetical protein
MIEKISGRVAYAVMSFGGFLGMCEQESTQSPGGKLTYDTSLGGYRTDITASKERLNARAMDGCFTLCAMTFLLGTVAI